MKTRCVPVSLLYAAAFMSAFLLLAMLILWPVSYYREVWVVYTVSGETDWTIGGNNGRLSVAVYSNEIRWSLPGIHFHTLRVQDEKWSYLSWEASRNETRNTSEYLGVLFDRLTLTTRANLHIPISYLAVLFAVLPTLSFLCHRRRRKEARVGHCPSCSYDLRAHHPGDKCPECGRVIEEGKQA